MPPNKSNYKQRSREKRKQCSISEGLEQSATDILNLLNDVEGAEGWYPVVHAICDALEIPDLSSRSGLKEIHVRFSDIAKNLDALYVKGKDEDVIVQAILAIYIRMCADAILRDRLVKESGLLSKTFALLGRPGCFRVALQALSAIIVHEGKEVREEIAKRTPSLLTVLEKHPDDEETAELALVVLCRSISAVIIRETVPNPTLVRSLDLPRLIPVIIRRMQNPSASMVVMAHAVPLLASLTEQGYRTMMACPSAINLLVAFSTASDVLTRSDAILGLMQMYTHQHDSSIPSLDPHKFWSSMQNWPDRVKGAISKYGYRRVDAFKIYTSMMIYYNALSKIGEDRDYYAFGRTIGPLMVETEFSVPQRVSEFNDRRTRGGYTPGTGTEVNLGIPSVRYVDMLPLAAEALRSRGDAKDDVLADYLEIKYLITMRTLFKPEGVAKVKKAIERHPRNGYFYYVLSMLPADDRECLRAAKKGLACPNLTDFLRGILLYRSLGLGARSGLELVQRSRWSDKRSKEEAMALLQSAWKDAKSFLDHASPDNRNMTNAIDWYIILSFALNIANSSTGLNEFKDVFDKLEVAEECYRHLEITIENSVVKFARIELVNRLSSATKEWGAVVRRYSEIRGEGDVKVSTARAEGDLMTWLGRFQSVDGNDDYSYQFLSVVHPKVNPNLVELYCCSWCQNPSAVLRKCSGCEKTRYCDASCQKEHWKLHREACKREAELMALRTKVKQTQLEPETVR